MTTRFLSSSLDAFHMLRRETAPGIGMSQWKIRTRRSSRQAVVFTSELEPSHE